MSRLLKGIYNLRPPLPRYSSTWDVSVLTQYLGTLFPSNSLSLKQLTLKTVSLCALCSAGRSQTLGALSISILVQHKESIQFIVTERLKTSRPGKRSAYNKGVPVENILKLANWSNESTSRRFYLRSAETGMPDSAVNVVHLV